MEQTYARARALCAQVGETPQLFSALQGLCTFYFVQGALLTARELGEQLDRLAQHTADPTRRMGAHYELGITLFFLGDYTTAQTHCEQGIALIDPTALQAQALNVAADEEKREQFRTHDLCLRGQSPCRERDPLINTPL